MQPILTETPLHTVRPSEIPWHVYLNMSPQIGSSIRETL